MTWTDGAALALFLVGWWFLHWLIDVSPWRKHAVSAVMKVRRLKGMRQMASRQVQLVDAAIITGLRQATAVARLEGKS